jgi:hypothetical protein
MSDFVVEKFHPEEGYQIIFDSSSLATAWQCLQLYKLEVIDRWRLKRANTAANFGKMVHAGLEFYDHAIVGLPHEEAALDTIRYCMEQAHLLADSEDNARTPQTFVRAVAWYMEKFKNDPLATLLLENGEPAVEVRFELPIADTPYRISGRVDRLGTIGKALWVLDRKTTKKALGPRYWEEFQPGVQVSTYFWAFKKMGLEPQGVMIDACQTLVNGTRWQRQAFELHDSVAEEFEDELRYIVERIDNAHTNGHWVRNRAVCNLYGGCRFRSVCNAMPHMRQRYLDADYQKVPYVPPHKQESIIE